jgi:hypothetical protein
MTTPTYMLDEKLKEYATPTQCKYIDAVNKHRSMREASRQLKVNFGTIRQSVESVKKKAALCGYAPAVGMVHPTTSPFIVKGVSTLYDEDGKQRAQWVKTKLDESRIEEVIREFVSGLVEEIKGTSKLVTPPKNARADLLNVIPIGDPHFGMYAWAAEAGDDFDTEIAEQVTIGAVDRLLATAPPADTCIVLPLGDVLHADDTKNRTPQSGNTLDVDTRHQRVMVIALRAIKHCIYRALEKHLKVIVRIVGGNHDPHSSFAIALALSEHFSNNPRVSVDLSPSLFWYFRFGKVLIGATHGDRAKGTDLLGVMASDRAEDWGQTKHRYWYHGHIHNRTVKEQPGVMVESFRTLAPKDAWHAGEGYRSGRDMWLITHHKEYGEIERHRCDIAMLEAA